VTRRLPSLADIKAGGPVIDVPTAAALLGISRSYGFELAARGEFPGRLIRVGSRWRVPRAALLELLEGNATGEKPCDVLPSSRVSGVRRAAS
jgi:excisionase family DNA binding protein